MSAVFEYHPGTYRNAHYWQREPDSILHRDECHHIRYGAVTLKVLIDCVEIVCLQYSSAVEYASSIGSNTCSWMIFTGRHAGIETGIHKFRPLYTLCILIFSWYSK